MKNKKIYLILGFIVVLGLICGSVFILNKDEKPTNNDDNQPNGSYILDASQKRQEFVYERLTQTKELGTIKLKDKTYPVTYIFDGAAQGDYQTYILRIGTKDFSFNYGISEGGTIYLLPETILIEERGTCSYQALTLLDYNLNLKADYLGRDTKMDWDAGYITYYQRAVEYNDEFGEYQLQFNEKKNTIETPKLIKKVTNFSPNC